MNHFGRSAVALILGALVLSGCGQLGAMSRVDPVSVAIYPGGESDRDISMSTAGLGDGCRLVRGSGSYSRGAVNLDCFRFPEDVNTGSTELAYTRAVESRRERNRLTSLLLKHSDDICVEEMGRLTANEATVNASLNILGTAATTTANIVTGNQAQQILTGVGTLANSSRSHLNSDVYRNTVAYAISRAITLERQRLRELIQGKYGTSENDFTIDDAIRAANEYHGICSFYKGLELVLASVEGDQRSREAQARRAQIDELEQQIREYREQMRGLSTDDAKPYRDRIDELVGRIQALTLAAVPLPPQAAAAENPQSANEVEANEPQEPAEESGSGNVGEGPQVEEAVQTVVAEPAVSAGQSAVQPDVSNALPSNATARWGSSGERQLWTEHAWRAVNEHGSALWREGFVPTDVATYCPGYQRQGETNRKLFWVGLMSSLARFESNFDPAVTFRENQKDSAGNWVISRGLLQLSQESSNGYGCGISDAQQLHDPLTNLSCGVRILARQVPRAGLIAGQSGERWQGAAAYWSPFRRANRRADIAAWTARQPYCAIV